MTGDRQPLSRRDFLKLSAVAGAALAIGGGGAGAVLGAIGRGAASGTAGADEPLPFYGEHQSGIVTPQQSFLVLAAFRVVASRREELSRMLREWTKFASQRTAGRWRQDSGNDQLPPVDTGEAFDLDLARLTLTFGFGPTLFLQGGKDRFGLDSRRPAELEPIPSMPGDHLDPAFEAGDIVVQACADDPQVAFHAVRNLIRLASGTATLVWIEEGFLRSPSGGGTPRNLFGFKDGTANRLHDSEEGRRQVVWAGAGEPAWMQGGTYLAYRKIRMLLEVWDRSSLQAQQDTFGRFKASGAAYGSTDEFDPPQSDRLPPDSHVALAKQSGQLIHRRAFSYAGAVDPRTGQLDAGLLFLSYQQSPRRQFVPMLRLMQSRDRLNEYTQHTASALFAIPGGIREGRYIGQALLEG
ncbi:iron uptake transporter deferrochelatase/peroxidase subunit [Paenibacillus pasadenensis]|uniref:iron uptake transporter deferrochelatase/peroxidase subunit n=1 Tax=Paenibacillus TaxID=44249 RepID=UPI000424397B|nr:MULTISPECIES: iron uptake transporter deferrochelatase/peroxidase subunit [Paenibacillus]QGG56362.1 deferrochelatase/peroxidase EfeB [Paenibacillus sp. B01]